MKNIQFTSRETDCKILPPLALLAAFATAGALFGFFMPTGYGVINGMPGIFAAISVGLTLFVWSIFRLIKPVYYDRNWKIAEVVTVPLYSLILTLAAGVCVAWLIQRSLHGLWEITDTIPFR